MTIPSHSDFSKLPSARAEAKEKAARHYFTGLPCKYGHIDKRFTKTGTCFSCLTARNQARPFGYKQAKYPPGVTQAERISIYNKRRYREVAEVRRKKLEKAKLRAVEKKAEIKAYLKAYHVRRKKEDPLFALSLILRKRHLMAFQRAKRQKPKSTHELLGASWEVVMRHLEQQFLPGMTWENHGRNGWHIDHIVPLASATTEQELVALFHYTNLQPLWASDNIRKGARKQETPS